MADHVDKKQKTGHAEGKAILYSYFRSSCSWRVRIALAMKQIPYEYRAVHLVNGEQMKPEFAQLNPMKEVPLYVENGKSIAQSLAIMEFLEELHPKPALLPADPYLRAKTRQLCQIIASDTQPVQNLRVLEMIKAKLGDKERQEWARHWIDNGLKGMEAEVARTAGKYCMGDSVTMADCCLIPQLFNARRFNVDLTPFPTLMRVEKALELLPECKAAHPDSQPDAPKEPAKP